MRDIKFRAFACDRLFYPEIFSFDSKGISFQTELGYLSSDKFEQFTGLQDKNGVDIYEGDIVSGVLYKDYTEHTGKVLFDYNGYMIVTKEKSITLKLTELLTVIGNIHEETK